MGFWNLEGQRVAAGGGVFVRIERDLDDPANDRATSFTGPNHVAGCVVRKGPYTAGDVPGAKDGASLGIGLK